MDPDQATRTLTRRPLRPRKPFTTIRQRVQARNLENQQNDQESRLENIRFNAEWNADFEEMIRLYRQLVSKSQDFLPGYSFESIFDRINSLKEGEMNQELKIKLERIVTLAKDLKLQPNQIALFMRTMETEKELRRDTNTSIDQIIASGAESTVQSKHYSGLIDPIGAGRVPSTTFIPYSGVIFYPQRFEASQIGK
jgi:hypothetical protein